MMILSLLLFYSDAFKKSVWSIWGGDVYFYKYKTDSLKDNLIEKLRKVVIPKIPEISYWMKGDYDKVCEVYKSKAKGITAKYPSPVNVSKIESLKPIAKSSGEPIKVMIGNSADPSNEHVETIKLLEKFSNENIQIFSILSYGSSKAYVENIISVGTKTFADKFIPVLNYMNYDEYLELLNNIDICVFNHKRQQGLGNQLIFLILEKKLYIDSTTTPFGYYKDKNIDVFDTSSIKATSYLDFISQSEESKADNRRKILKFVNENVIIEEWKEVFSD